MERLSSGNKHLDDILHGGFVANAITLIAGAPGTGKTILAEQCLFENATAERPALYLSTVSEPFDKLLRYGQAMEFFDVEQVGVSVFYDDLGNALNEHGLDRLLERVDELVKEHRPGIVVIDSFKALRDFAPSEMEYRRLLHQLSARFNAFTISSFWVGEYGTHDALHAPEFGVADTVLYLELKRTSERVGRYLSVMKMRGSGFSAGEHAFRVEASGIRVFPRLADDYDGSGHFVAEGRLSTGIPALDDALGDGYWPGSTTLIAGPSGAGKTMMGLHFLFTGATHREPGILVTLQENRTQLDRIIGQFDWDVASDVTILDRSPVALLIDELVYELIDCIERTGARRVVIDSLGDLLLTTGDGLRFRELVYSLVQRCSRSGVSLMFTLETPELFQITRLSELGMSHISDNVILLQHFPSGTEMKRSLTVLKTRGSNHASSTREFHITDLGITLGNPVDMRALLRM